MSISSFFMDFYQFPAGQTHTQMPQDGRIYTNRSFEDIDVFDSRNFLQSQSVFETRTARTE